ncbi:hypothetical protein V6N12_067844 [Hibiscus sabdariffa]|uniref:Uncharacterized protein n=1 Tax=Hibiscus sabdariffa TaxID=183260 RepID=A0ABR2FNP0_9ROSI
MGHPSMVAAPNVVEAATHSLSGFSLHVVDREGSVDWKSLGNSTHGNFLSDFISPKDLDQQSDMISFMLRAQFSLLKYMSRVTHNELFIGCYWTLAADILFRIVYVYSRMMVYVKIFFKRADPYKFRLLLMEKKLSQFYENFIHCSSLYSSFVVLMEVVKPSSVTPLKSKGVRALWKVFHLYATTIEKVKPKETKEWNDSK